MDERKMIDDLKNIIPYVKGIIVYGSHVKGYADKRSDIDICIVKKEEIDEKELFYEVLRIKNKKYDVVIFDEIPWYLRGEVLENGKIIYAEDLDELDFWIYKQLKIWNDMKRRKERVTEDELMRRLKNE